MANARIWLVIGCSALLGACEFSAINGSGKVITEPRTVVNIAKVTLSGEGQLIIEQTGTESLTVTTDDNLLQYIKTDVQGDTLDLGTRDLMTSLRPSHDIIFKLTVKRLEGVQVSGSGRVTASGLTPEHLNVGISGSGDATLHGSTGDLDLNISGSGTYRGDDLKTKAASVHVSGSGGALVNAADTLDAHVSGSGNIAYLGTPHLTQSVSGSGSVEPKR